MSEAVIKVRGLGKRYCLGSQARIDQTIPEAISETVRRAVGMVKRPTRRVKRADKQDFWALRDVSFDINEGEVLGIIGRNGAGKSTLLKILSQITDPSEGHATVHGRVASLLEVGTGFHPELTGRENIYLNGSILGMSHREIKSKFEEIVDFSGVEKFLDTPIKRYSSGMTMRLAFSVAAHLEPEILVIDEVLAVGDAMFQKKCLGKMNEVAQSGRTILFVSHNMNAIEELCQKVIYLEDGMVQEYSGNVREVISRYLFGQEHERDSCVWVNPGTEFENPWFKLLRMSLTDHGGSSLNLPVSNNCDIWVQVEAEVKQIDPALTIGYAIYNEAGQVLFWSYQTDQSEAQWPKLKTGHNVLRGRIPKRLLNEGAYRVELIGGLHCRQWLYEPGVEAPAITLTILGGLSDSPLWVKKRPGVFAPVVDWMAAA